MKGYENVKHIFRAPLRISMVHGKQTNRNTRNQRGYSCFKQRDTHILVGTTVIGSRCKMYQMQCNGDESAENSVCHEVTKLRGRVGRGSEKLLHFINR